jgi:hypothetical protein
MKLAASPSLKNSLLINCVHDLRPASSEPQTASLLKKTCFPIVCTPKLAACRLMLEACPFSQLKK